MSLDDGYVNADYLKKMAERARSLKELSYQHMAITPGMTLIDVGCGPGVDTPALAQLTGVNGRVIGIDSDAAMLAEADKVIAGNELSTIIEHREGSATELPLENNSVDACRAERLLQVLSPDVEQQVVSEMVRATKPGGRIVLVDTDWGSASVDFSDGELERRLLTFFAREMRPNGFAGRRLYSLCHQHQLCEIQLDTIPFVEHSYEESPLAEWLITTALQQNIINEDEANAWRGELMTKQQKRSFYSCVNLVIVSGTVPEC
ncbi:MAG: methyltransferase domain-containing protein [Chromatiales bacterium]|nr:methyltransferase domain-containing protein [Chromatiales bacterium]